MVNQQRFHIAIAVRELEPSLREYTRRLGVEPCCVVEGTYALFRTEQVNFSISVKPEAAGTLRHLGFEDAGAPAMAAERDVNGIEWEHFTEAQQRAEILRLWPHARFR